MKVLPPLELEPATSNAGGIEGTIGLLGCSLRDSSSLWARAPPWLNGSTSTMRDWRSWVQFPWVTSTFNVDIAQIFVFYLAMVRNCCGLLWRQSGGCSYLPYTMSAKAFWWVPLDRDWCTLYEINKSMFMFMFMFIWAPSGCLGVGRIHLGDLGFLSERCC